MFTKILLTVAVLFSVTLGAAAWADSTAVKPASILPNVVSVLPDPLPLDMAQAPSVVDLAPTYVEAKVTKHKALGITIESSATVYIWECGAPHALETDNVQTVRDCEWIKR